MARFKWYRPFVLLALIAWSPSCRHQADDLTVPAPPPGHYFPQVRALVHAHCTASCHAPSQGYPDGSPITLESDADIAQHAAAIKAAVADPVSPFNHRMPPNEDTLDASQVATIVAWYEAGGRVTDCPLNVP